MRRKDDWRYFNNKEAIINNLKLFLFKQEDERLSKQLEGLLELNAQHGGNRHGFLHNGKFYSNHNPRLHRSMEKVRISFPLIQQANEYINEVTRRDDDERVLSMAIAVLFPTGRMDYQDIRDSLPDMVRDFMPQVAELRRTRPEAFHIINDPIKMKTWNAGLRVIERLMINKLVF